MSTGEPDPYTVLGVDPGATSAEIAAAYRRAVRTCHPDAPHPDSDRLAAVIAAYRRLRDRDRDVRPPAEHSRDSSHGHDIPVRIHPPTSPRTPDIWAGPVRRHPPAHS
ncbi:MAG TPA: J domain-containing protein [Actinophytocola sp.]|uniref:J domain-containing protein n=1 Tax=Actinophytocola sp. TaxID=1872138 RepID=UPI002DB5E18C|nr:J domain-containing protein [Actinophytocola sp.]HEU5469395.1 J domain-containing protein [Actinophytocola sp.]